MFNKQYLYITKIYEHQPPESPRTKIKVRTSKIDSIIFISESKIISSMGWGFLIGAVIGGLSGLAAEDDEFISREGTALIAGVTVGLAGGFIGLIIGAISSADNETFRYDYQIDLLKLKDYAKYYFKYDESVEQSYEPME